MGRSSPGTITTGSLRTVMGGGAVCTSSDAEALVTRFRTVMEYVVAGFKASTWTCINLTQEARKNEFVREYYKNKS